MAGSAGPDLPRLPGCPIPLVRRQPRLRQRLRRVLDWAVAYSGNGLRCEGMHAKRPEGPTLSRQRPPLPARAMSAQVKLASPVYPVYPVPRADRGPAPITRLIHHPPPDGPLPDPGPRSCTLLITHRVNALSRRPTRPLQGQAYHADTIRVSPCRYRAATPPARYRPVRYAGTVAAARSADGQSVDATPGRSGR